MNSSTTASFSAEDSRHMAHALRLARFGRFTTHPNPRVGCLIVSPSGEIFEGWHECAGEAHAEVHALQGAGIKALAATCYVTLEPCSHQGRTPPCADSLIEAGLSRVVVALQDPNPLVAGQGIARLRAAGIQVDVGLLMDEAESLNRGFTKRMRQGLPYVRCKLGMSLDGRTAMASGESQWITSAESRQDVQQLRAESSAIVTGIDTVLADDCALTVREFETDRQPIRVVLDSQLRIPEQAKILQQSGETWIMTAAEGQRSGARLFKIGQKGGRLDLLKVMQQLAENEINEVLLEAGPTLSGAMLQAGLVDELIIYAAPRLLGDNARGLLHLPGLERLEQAIDLQLTDVRSIGNDLRIIARPERLECLPES